MLNRLCGKGGSQGICRGVKLPFYGGLQGAGSRAHPQKIGGFLCFFLAVFWNMVFSHGFLIVVKELGLLNNTGQWIRFFGIHGITYIFYCKQ